MLLHIFRLVTFVLLTLGFVLPYKPLSAMQNEVSRKTIANITITGNKQVAREAILARIPYRIGQPFNPSKTGELIRNVYALNFFNDVQVDIDELSNTEVSVNIMVAEKKKIESICYEGNTHLSADEIEKKLKLTEIPAMDEEEIEQYAHQIKLLYAEKNYHTVTIKTELRPTDHGTYIAAFIICEGNKAVVKRVLFKGNLCVQSKKLREIIFTREDWIFGFLSKAGSYQPHMIDVDRHIIENFYQSNGYLTARVVDVQIDTDPVSQCMTVTYSIEEGDLFTIKCVSAPLPELEEGICIKEEQFVAAIPIKCGQLYNKDLIRQSMESLRVFWGKFGYIYADIEPVIVPNFEEKTVDVTFNSDLGSKVFVNRINIIGNCKTRDYVIRRNILACEGELLTGPALDVSKNKIESLGYFNQDGGVEWKINKVAPDLVDLDLMLKEVQTGRIEAQLGYGGADPKSPSTGARIGIGISDRRLFGTGIRANMNASWSKEDHSFMFNVFQPWFYNRPIGAGFGFYHRRSLYEDFKNVSSTPREKLIGGDAQITFAVPGCPDIYSSVTGGLERIEFQQGLRAALIGRAPAQNALMQTFIDRRFTSGTIGWISAVVGQDLRNHPVFPNRGYNWSFVTRYALPQASSTFGYLKGDFDVTWMTPLIGEYDLIFLLHGHAGFVKPLDNKLIPYRELYNMGGPGTVRGFEFGQIGPQIFCSSVGAQKAFWVNAELIFSITKDQSIRGIVFYDGGAGWDTPLTREQINLLNDPINAGALTNNEFRYRHSIGFGLRLLKPAPFRIDWGFKLDRNKKAREKFYEVHFSMAQDF